MSTKLSLIVFAMVLGTAATTAAQQPFFLQMADPQFGMFTDNQTFAQETANFELAIATANKLHPMFVVVAGDLVNKRGDSAQIAEYLRVTRQLLPAIPLYNVAGNHDVGNSPTTSSLEAYRKIFGRDYYSFHAGEFEGIVLNSSIIQHPEHVMEEEVRQREWLQLELARAAASGVRQIVIFQHIPWFLRDPDEPDQYFNIPRDTRARYLKILEDAGVHYVFAGHLHHNAEAVIGTLHMISTGPIGKPLGKGASGFRLVILGQDRLCNSFHSLDALPTQADVASATCAADPNLTR